MKIRKLVERYFERVDIAVAIAATAALSGWGRFGGGESLVIRLLDKNRGLIYPTCATLFGTLFGFVIAATAIVITFGTSPRLILLRESRHWPTFWRVFTVAMRSLAGAAIWAAIALIFDRDSRPMPLITYLSVGIFLFGLLKLYRVLWVFETVTRVMTMPDRKIRSFTGHPEDEQEPAAKI